MLLSLTNLGLSQQLLCSEVLLFSFACLVLLPLSLCRDTLALAFT
jgi:hypothetical protein